MIWPRTIWIPAGRGQYCWACRAGSSVAIVSWFPRIFLGITRASNQPSWRAYPITRARRNCASLGFHGSIVQFDSGGVGSDEAECLRTLTSLALMVRFTIIVSSCMTEPGERIVAPFDMGSVIFVLHCFEAIEQVDSVEGSSVPSIQVIPLRAFSQRTTYAEIKNLPDLPMMERCHSLHPSMINRCCCLWSLFREDCHELGYEFSALFRDAPSAQMLDGHVL